jgi:hypothetical protein
MAANGVDHTIGSAYSGKNASGTANPQNSQVNAV